jgi:hypothetical protein
MNAKNPFEVADESYEPCDPHSQPNTELVDYIKEPVDQWILENSTIEADIYRKARSVWAELGQQAVPEGDSIGGPDSLQDSYIRQVQPATVKRFAERLHPMTFESVGLAMIPLDLLAQIEQDPVIIGQMFGVPREGGYVPLLILDTTIQGGKGRCLNQMHMLFHLVNDIFSDEPAEEIEVLF